MKTWQKLRDDPDLWPRYLAREKIIRSIRSFFDTKNFHEVETPILIQNPPAESYLEIFETMLLDRHRKGRRAYLSTSPEVALKKLLVAGIGNCFSLTKSFRNTETDSRTHQPEFTILEWYRVGATYRDIMTDCEDLITHLATIISREQRTENKKQNLRSKSHAHCPMSITYQGKAINLTPPWERISVAQAFAKFANVDFQRFLELDEARVIAKAKGYEVNNKNTWEELYDQIYLNEVEPRLGVGTPTIIYDFPGSLAALARKKPDDPKYAERFELYIGGLELADCYTELTDPTEQEERFEKELQELKRLGKTTYDFDHDFIDALRVGLPPCAGIALGIDRLIMLLTDCPSIDDITFFPISEWDN